MTVDDEAADCVIKGISTDRIHVDTKFSCNLAAMFTCVDVVMLVPSNRTPKKRSEAEAEEAGLFRRFTKHKPNASPDFANHVCERICFITLNTRGEPAYLRKKLSF